jgi:hypothetical protein
MAGLLYFICLNDVLAHCVDAAIQIFMYAV